MKLGDSYINKINDPIGFQQLNQAADELAIASAKKNDHIHSTDKKYGENHWKKAGISFDDVMKSEDNDPVANWYNYWIKYPGYYSSHAANQFGMNKI